MLSPEPPSIPVILPFRPKTTDRRWVFWLGLAWGEWYAHSRLILFFLGAWLVTVWVLPQFTNPGWLLAFGCVYALIAGPVMGGRDVLEGCEEYSFSLPATRSEWFRARWAVGAGMLALFTLLDLLALGLDISQAMTRFYLDTGLIEAKGVPRLELLYALIFAFPLACFSFSFSLAAVARGRGLVLSAALWGALLALVVLRLGLLYEFWEWKGWTGYFSCPALFLAAGLFFGLGLRIFRSKELVPPSRPWNMPSFWWAWVLLVLGGLGLTTFLLSSLGRELAKILSSR